MESAAASDVNVNILNKCRQEGEWLDSSIIDAYLERIVSSGRPGVEFVPNFIIDMYLGNKKEHAEEIGNWIIKIDWPAIQLLFVPVFLAPNHWAMGVYRPNEQEFTMFDSKTSLGRVDEKVVFMGKMTEFFADIAQIYGQIFDEDVHLVERTNAPQQDNASDCGVFALMFAYYIGKEARILDNFNHCNMNANVFREKIYQDLYAIKFGQQTSVSAAAASSSGDFLPLRSGREVTKSSRSRRLRSLDTSTLSEKKKDDEDENNAKLVYKTLLFEKYFYDKDHLDYAQREIAHFFYKKLCWSILSKYDNLENETTEFKGHYQRLKLEYEVIAARKEMLKVMTCAVYKFFIRLIHDKVLEQSSKWREYFNFRIRHFFWIEKEWDKNTQIFLKKINWRREGDCTEEECEQLRLHLSKEPQTYHANYWSLKWLLNNSVQFIRSVAKKQKDTFLEMKKRIFVLTGDEGFDRLELATSTILKIGSTISEFIAVCLKRYLEGGEDARRFELRMSISLLINNIFIFRDSLAEKAEQSEGNVRQFCVQNLEKFDNVNAQIYDNLVSIVDLEAVSGAEEESLLQNSLCILLKLFEITDDGLLTITMERFIKMNIEYLLNCTKEDLKKMNKQREEILAPFYLRVVDRQLAEADQDLRRILKYTSGAIFRLSSLVGGNENLLEIWNDHKETIRSQEYFSLGLDQRARKYYEIFLTNDNSEARLLSKIHLNVFFLLNSMEKSIGKNKSFSTLLEDWRCLGRIKIDGLQVMPEFSPAIDKEMTIMGNMMIEFVQKWGAKKINAKTLRDVFYKEQEEVRLEIGKLMLNKKARARLSYRFQNIHIAHLAKLAEDDKRQKTAKQSLISSSVAKAFNFWEFFQKLSSKPDGNILVRLDEILDVEGMRKLHDMLGLQFFVDKFTPEIVAKAGQTSMEPTLEKQKSKKKATSIARVQSLLEEGGGQEGLSKSAKKKLKSIKSKLSTTSTEDEEKKSVAGSIKLRRSESTKGSGRGGGRAGIGATMEMAGGALRRSESAKEEKEGKTLPQSMASKFSDTEDAEQRRRRNLRRFSLEQRRSSIASAEGGTPSWRREETTSAPRGSQILDQILESGTTHGSSAQIKEFLEGSRSRTTERQRSGGRQTLARILAENEQQQQQLLMFLHKSCWKNNHLYMLYENFLTNPTILMRAVLDACLYINEIYAKLSLAEIISDYGRRKWPIPLWQINGGKVERLKEKWQQIVDKQLVLVKAKEDIDKLKTNLHALLYQVQMVLNEGGGGDEGRQSSSLIGSSSSMEEMGDALFQMHSIKLSHFLCIKSESQRWIDEFMERSKNAVFGLLYQSEDLSAELRVSKKNYQRFLDRIEAWDKYENQRALDDQLVRQYRVDDFMPIKSHYWQQIMLGNHEKERHSTLTRELQEKIKFVDRYIEAEERMEYERAQTFKTAVDAVGQIAREWNKNAELLHTGSYLIGALTVNSDVDTICMLPERITLDMFFGDAKCEILETKPGRGGGIRRIRTCADHSSLHCAFCLNPNVMYLSKVETARVPLLKFSYCLDEDIGMKKFTKCQKEVEFDLLFAAVKQAGSGYDIDGYAKLLQAMDERAMDREQIATYTSLTGYQQNTVINDVLSRNKRNFRITVAAIKHWAKKYHIYNPFHGFLKGIGVTIMAAKIATMFPNSTVPFLLQMFFFYFLEWPWKMPVQLMKVQNLTKDGKPLWEIEERSKREQWHAHLGISTELMMPVISPWQEDDISFSSSNVMTENTREIVFKAMQNALYSLNQIQAGQAGWDLLLNGMDISTEYQYFIVINCGRRYQKLSDDLCSFTNSKLANQIIYDVVKNNRNFTNIRRAHIMHTAGDSDNRCIVPGGEQVYNTHFCKTWLVGLKFFPRGENNFLKEHFEQKLHKENLLIVEKYMGTLGRKENKQKFDEFTRNRADYFILSKFVQLKELTQWGITLRGSEIVHQ